MSSSWDSKPRQLAYLKVCFVDSTRFVSHVRSAFNFDQLLEELIIRIHYWPKSIKGYFDELNLDLVISTARILDRNYTLQAKHVIVHTDILVFDAYLEGFCEMPQDLCFASRLPTLETL